MSICSVCGTIATSKFCPECGAGLKTPTVILEPAPPPTLKQPSTTPPATPKRPVRPSKPPVVDPNLLDRIVALETMVADLQKQIDDLRTPKSTPVVVTETTKPNSLMETLKKLW